jgi:hypothetical protein
MEADDDTQSMEADDDTQSMEADDESQTIVSDDDSQTMVSDNSSESIVSEDESKTLVENEGFQSIVTGGDIIITYSPEAKFVNNDQIQIGETNMIPPHKNESFKVLEIISPTQIRVNIPDITTYATSGQIILKTNMDNRLNDSAKKTVQDVKTGTEKAASTVINVGGAVVNTAGNVVGNVAGSVAEGTSGIFNKVTDIFGSYITYAKYFCYFICFILFVGAIYKIYTMAAMVA